MMRRSLVNYMHRSPSLFQKVLFKYIERLITLESDIALVENLYSLFEGIFREMAYDRAHSSK